MKSNGTYNGGNLFKNILKGPPWSSQGERNGNVQAGGKTFWEIPEIQWKLQGTTFFRKSQEGQPGRPMEQNGKFVG
jgi:hypothetical protein